MENMGDLEQKNMINELSQGRELARQLQIQLNVSPSSHETREFLVHKILASYDRVLSMLKEPQHQSGGTGVLAMSESPRSTSPHSEDSDREFKDPEHKDTHRKRKTMPRWTRQVQVCAGSGLEGSLDDGYSWRKYGQKDILGAKYPRGYYRCSHRNVQGCSATKQVQRSDDDPTIIELTYRGIHTCNQGSTSSPSLAPSPQQPESQTRGFDNQQQTLKNQPVPQQSAQEMLLNFNSGLNVVTRDMDAHEQQPFSSFGFATTSNAQPGSYGFTPNVLETNPPCNFSYGSSGSNFFSLPPSHLNCYGGNQSLQSSEAEISGGMISAATSVASSPTVAIDFPFGQHEFDPSFTFDSSGFFS